MLKVPTSFVPRPQQVDMYGKLLHLYARITILICHRRFGKTAIVIIAMLIRAITETGNYFIVSPSLRQGRRTIWDFKLQGESIFKQIPSQLIKSIDRVEMRVEFINGSVLQILGATDGADSIVGIGAKMIVIDEVELVDESVYGYLLPIAVMDRSCQIVMTGTPRAGAWVYNLITNPPKIKDIIEDMHKHGSQEMEEWDMLGDDAAYEAVSLNTRTGISEREYKEYSKYYKEHEFTHVEQWSITDTNMLSLPELEAARQDVINLDGNDNRFRQEFYLDWNAANAKSIYGEHLETARNEGRVASWKHNPSFPVSCSLDLGIMDNTVITIWQRVGTRMIILDTYINSSAIHDHYIQYIRESPYDIKKVYLPHDSNNKNKETGRTTYDYYVNNLPDANVIYTPKTDSVESDIMRIRGEFFPSLYFNTDSKGVRELLSKLDQYDYKRRADGSSQGTLQHSDWADSFRYAVLNAFEDDKRARFTRHG